jgi:hypothetical protein
VSHSVPVFTNAERLALAGFLAGSAALFAAPRADIECFARDLEARWRA